MKDLKEQKSIRRFNKDAEVTLQIFSNGEFGEVRTTVIDEKPYFVGIDIANALGYKNPQKAIRDHCKGVNETFIPSSGGKQLARVIPEGDIYRLIVRSKLPTAERFETWVFDEVLPQIRQTGGYIPVSEEDTEQEILSKALSIMKNTLDKKDKLLKQQQKVIEEQKPLAEFGQALAKSDTSILIREMAKIITQNTFISMGEKKFYSWLRENKYIMQGSTEPYQRRIEQGLFERKASGTFTRSDGTTHTSYTTYVTPKGQQHFIDKFRRLEK